jgi:multicomponent Na+:H+ antiporter subunit D
MNAIVLVICLPFAGAVASFLLGRRVAAAVGLTTAAGTTAAAVAVARQVWSHGPARHAVGGWGAPLGIDLFADGLSGLMLLTTAAVALVLSIYSLAYFPAAARGGWAEREGFWPLWLMLWGALNAIFLSADIFNYYVVLELITLPAVALIVLSRQRVALGAATRYLLAAFLGSLSYLMGVALLYAAFGVLDMQALGERMTPGLPAGAALSLMTVGLLLKTALFPLHFWLPQAHASAPAPGSAVLSALVVKASFYVLLRLWFGVFGEAVTLPAGQVLGVLGAGAIFWGSLQALRQPGLKLLVAYSTVAQIGYLFLLIPLVMDPQAGAAAGAGTVASSAWKGGMYHVVSHAFAKAAMFMAAGTIMYALGHDHIRRLGGVAESLPVSTHAFGLAGLNLVGLPPTGGFVSKWLLVNSAIAAGQWWVAAVLLIGGLLAAGYVFLFIREASLAQGEGTRIRPVPAVMEWTAMALALASLVLGLRAAEPLALLEIGSPFPTPAEGALAAPAEGAQ